MKSEAKKAYHREWEKRNRERLNVYRKELRLKNLKFAREKANSKHQKRLEQMAGRAKSGYCEVCGKNDRVIHFDHDHISGKFRGWLCSNCNHILGLSHDSSTILRQLARYLEESKIPSEVRDYELHAC